MTNIQFEFKPEKALEAILYIAKNTKETATYMRVIKLLYLADKTSLEKYGRFISGDTYYAMKDGPVPTNSYDMLKNKDTTDKGFEIIKVQYPTIKPYRDANLDYLSESDTDCLDKTLRAFDHLPTWSLRELTHDEAWAITWEQSGRQGSQIITLQSIAELLENSEQLLDYLNNQNS